MRDSELTLAASMMWSLVREPPSSRKDLERIAYTRGVTDPAARMALIDDMEHEFDWKLRAAAGHFERFSTTPHALNAKDVDEVYSRYKEYRTFAYYKTRLQCNIQLCRRASRTTLSDKLGLTFQRLREAESDGCSRVAESLTGITPSIRDEYEKLWTELGLRESQEASWWHSSTCNKELEDKLRGLDASHFEGVSDRDITDTVDILSEIASATQDSEAPVAFKILRRYLPEMTARIDSRFMQLPAEDRDMYAFESHLVNETSADIVSQQP